MLKYLCRDTKYTAFKEKGRDTYVSTMVANYLIQLQSSSKGAKPQLNKNRMLGFYNPLTLLDTLWVGKQLKNCAVGIFKWDGCIIST